MPVNIDIMALVIPIRNINKVYPGGFEQYRIDHSTENRLLFDHDDQLVRIGAMDSQVIEAEIRFWEKLGLQQFEMHGKNIKAKDFYFVSNWAKTKNECPWLTIDPRGSTVSWKHPHG